MYHPHTHPHLIITSYLACCTVFVDQEEDEVGLYGVYGDLLTANYPTIFVVTNMETFKSLLEEAPEQEKCVMDMVKEKLENPYSPDPLQLTDGALIFTDHIFSFGIIWEEPEVVKNSPEPDYYLVGYMKRGSLLKEFMAFDPPKEQKKIQIYHNRLLSMRYELYTSLRRQLGMKKALLFSGLGDPLVYKMARRQYEGV